MRREARQDFHRDSQAPYVRSFAESSNESKQTRTLRAELRRIAVGAVREHFAQEDPDLPMGQVEMRQHILDACASRLREAEMEAEHSLDGRCKGALGRVEVKKSFGKVVSALASTRDDEGVVIGSPVRLRPRSAPLRNVDRSVAVDSSGPVLTFAPSAEGSARIAELRAIGQIVRSEIWIDDTKTFGMDSFLPHEPVPDSQYYDFAHDQPDSPMEKTPTGKMKNKMLTKSMSMRGGPTVWVSCGSSAHSEEVAHSVSESLCNHGFNASSKFSEDHGEALRSCVLFVALVDEAWLTSPLCRMELLTAIWRFRRSVPKGSTELGGPYIIAVDLEPTPILGGVRQGQSGGEVQVLLEPFLCCESSSHSLRILSETVAGYASVVEALNPSIKDAPEMSAEDLALLQQLCFVGDSMSSSSEAVDESLQSMQGLWSSDEDPDSRVLKSALRSAAEVAQALQVLDGQTRRFVKAFLEDEADTNTNNWAMRRQRAHEAGVAVRAEISKRSVEEVASLRVAVRELQEQITEVRAPPHSQFDGRNSALGLQDEESHRIEPDSCRDSAHLAHPAAASPIALNLSDQIALKNQVAVSTGRSAFQNSSFGPFSSVYTAQRKGVGALSAEKRKQFLQEMQLR